MVFAQRGLTPQASEALGFGEGWKKVTA